jgi:hypothetical protein
MVEDPFEGNLDILREAGEAVLGAPTHEPHVASRGMSYCRRIGWPRFTGRQTRHLELPG